MAGSGNVTFTQQQFEQLLKNPPGGSKCSETDDELDQNFATMAFCLSASTDVDEWIIDSGASDHMTSHIDHLKRIKHLTHRPKINLPNEEKSSIMSSGEASLCNNLVLKDVLHVPSFTCNLLSV